MGDDESQQEGQEPEPAEIIIEPDQFAGVWANFARVSHSEHEFTLDFIRMDYSQGSPPRRGIVVARVGFSPLFVLAGGAERAEKLRRPKPPVQNEPEDPAAQRRRLERLLSNEPAPTFWQWLDRNRLP
jgi:hypothetical protein